MTPELREKLTSLILFWLQHEMETERHFGFWGNCYVGEAAVDLVERIDLELRLEEVKDA